MRYDRQRDIIRYLEENHSATIRQLAGAVFASEASVRRDISLLEEQGIVSRVYGGVILSKHQNAWVPLALRKQENSAQKDQIARQASKLIFDGATVFIDASSTAGRIVKYLGGYKNLKVITNSISVLEEASRSVETVWSVGGRFFRENKALVGPEAERFIRSVNIDLLLFSSEGVSREGEISDSSERETSLRRALLERSERKVFLCDASKLGVRRMFQLCSVREVDDIICDIPLTFDAGEKGPNNTGEKSHKVK